jgi:hypothetical protein
MALAGSVCLMYEEHDTSTLADTQVLLVSPLLGVAAAPLPLPTSLYSLLPLLQDSHMPSLCPPPGAPRTALIHIILLHSLIQPLIRHPALHSSTSSSSSTSSGNSREDEVGRGIEPRCNL